MAPIAPIAPITPIAPIAPIGRRQNPVGAGYIPALMRVRAAGRVTVDTSFPP
jgi:hypothetical protein